jgi:16S rRNA (guanine527-N7)-methyltransferase
MTAGRSDNISTERAQALALTPVSRETEDRLDRFVTLLGQWQSRINLIAPSTIPTVWTRHIADSLQLLDLAPTARTWVDFGSGGGFPGLAVACALAETPGAQVHLIESNGKKAAFLREAARVTGAPAIVHHLRAVDFLDKFRDSADVVTARAVAPLAALLTLTYPLLQTGAIGLFPKGQDVGLELTEASKCWTIQASLTPSRTDSHGRIVCVRVAKPNPSDAISEILAG